MIEKIKSEKFLGGIDNYGLGYNEAIDNTIDIVRELDEPEKPVVPQYVADWYEDNKDDFEYSVYDLCVKLHEYELNGEIKNWFDSLNNKPIETLVMMHKFGYEVEKEKLYTVELPNPNAVGHVVLCKTSDGEVAITFASTARWRGSKNVQLTESEIKKDFGWAWQFAKEVKE